MIAAIPLCLSHKKLAYIEIVGPIILTLTIIFGVLLENKDIVLNHILQIKHSHLFPWLWLCISASNMESARLK